MIIRVKGLNKSNYDADTLLEKTRGVSFFEENIVDLTVVGL